MLLRLPQALYLFAFPRLTIAQIPGNSLRTCVSTAFPSENYTFNFNEQEINRILNLINTKSGEHLASYDISKAKLKKLEAWKSKNGDFHNLNDVLHLDGFSVKLVEKFCKSLLTEDPVKRPPRKASSYVTPAMPETQIGQINSSVSINVGVSSLVWSRLELNKDGPCELTHWQVHDIKEKKLHLHDLIHRCLYVEHMIPQADCYLFENPHVAPSATPGNAEQVNINVQRAQMTAILGFALAKRRTSTELSESNIFYLKRFLAARLFQHLIGTERVSAEKTILNLMRTYYNVDDVLDTEDEEDVGAESFSNRGNVSFPVEMRTLYKEAQGYHREFLGQTLLLNLAFVRLVLLRDAKARALLSRSPKANEAQ